MFMLARCWRYAVGNFEGPLLTFSRLCCAVDGTLLTFLCFVALLTVRWCSHTLTATLFTFWCVCEQALGCIKRCVGRSPRKFGFHESVRLNKMGQCATGLVRVLGLGLAACLEGLQDDERVSCSSVPAGSKLFEKMLGWRLKNQPDPQFLAVSGDGKTWGLYIHIVHICTCFSAWGIPWFLGSQS